MSIGHRFLNVHRGGFNGDHRFWTVDGVLRNEVYEPEVLFVGTFNPDTPHANFTDFFYGRNYFWPALSDLLQHNAAELLNRRMPPNGTPQDYLEPSLEDILELCSRGRLAFADLVGCVLHNGDPEYALLPNDNLIWNGVEYNLIQDGARNGIAGLAQLHAHGQVQWITDAIIEYLNQTPSIRFVYLTRQPNTVWEDPWTSLVRDAAKQGRSFTNIYSPSGQGLVGAPRMVSLLHHWVHNQDHGFGQLDHQWLIEQGVDPNNF